MIVNFWPQWFRDLYGGGWPKDYCCVDVETTGYAFDRDVITEWGHVLVQDGKVVDRLALVLDWTGHPIVQEHWLRNRLQQVQQGMALSGKKCHHSVERMKAEGMKPDKALAFVRDFTATIQKKGILFVAHGGGFDEKMIAANFIGFKVARGFSFGDNGMLDTEGIEKATQLASNERMHPRRGDTLRSYFHRVKYTRVNGVKSNLDEHCYAKYGLEARGVARDDLHSAGVDSLCCHHLMEIWRAMLTEHPVPPPVYPSADHKMERKAQAPPTRTPARPAATTTRIRGQRRT